MLPDFGQINRLMEVLYHRNPVFSTHFSNIITIMVPKQMQWDTIKAELERGMQVRLCSLGYERMNRHFRIV